MGTTRIKIIDLSSEEKQIKTSRKRARLASLTKRAEKLTGAAKIKEPEKKKVPRETEEPKEPKEQEVKEEKSATSATDKQAKAKKETQHHKGAKYQQAKKLVEDRLYKVKEAIELLPKTSTVKFDSAVEIHLNVSEKNVKGNVNFPHSFGAKQKKLKYLIFSDLPSKALVTEGKQIIRGDDTTIADIEGGRLKAGRDFDSVISTPKFMPKLAKIAKILGPKGMMPNPKNGTIGEDFEKVISQASESGYAYKSDPTAPIIHAKVGKLSQKPADLEENLKTLTVAIGLSKIKKATLASTMGPAIKLDIASL